MDAIIYRRFSSDEQEKGSGETLQRQLDRCEAMARDSGWTVIEVLTDKGRSAYKNEHLKPDAELGKFVARVGAGEFPNGVVLVAERIDRLSRRKVGEFMAWVHAITTAGIQIAIADKRTVFDANPSIGDFITTAISAGGSHEESAKKSDLVVKAKKVLWSKAEAKEGNWTNLAGLLPSWLTRSPTGDAFIVDEERAKTIRTIYHWSADGIGVNTICNMLNDQGRLTPPLSMPTVYKSGVPKWGRSSVRQLLTSPIVEGDFRPKTGIFVGRVLHDFYPRIVDADLVSRARSALTARKKVGGQSSSSGHSNLFAGVTKCGICGRRAFLSTSVRKGRSYPYLRCEAAQEGRCTNKNGYAYRAFEDTALDLFLDLALDDRFFEVTTALRQGRVRFAEIEKSIVDASAFRARLMAAFGEGDDDPQALEIIAAKKAEIDDLGTELAEVEAAIQKATGQVGNIEHLRRVGDIREAARSDDESVRIQCQSASKRDPLSACNRDPLVGFRIAVTSAPFAGVGA